MSTVQRQVAESLAAARAASPLAQLMRALVPPPNAWPKERLEPAAIEVKVQAATWVPSGFDDNEYEKKRLANRVMDAVGAAVSRTLARSERQHQADVDKRNEEAEVTRRRGDKGESGPPRLAGDFGPGPNVVGEPENEPLLKPATKAPAPRIWVRQPSSPDYELWVRVRGIYRANYGAETADYLADAFMEAWINRPNVSGVSYKPAGFA